MTFDAIYSSAMDVLNKLSAYERFGPETTVCVLSTRSGRIFYGVSRVETVNGMPMEVHAEIIAFREMQAMGETAVETLILLSAVDRSPLIPCPNCAMFIMQSGDNASTTVALPDRMIRLSEIAGTPAKKPVASKGSLLKDKVGDLMSVMEDEDDEDEDIEEEKPKKKKFFGLF